jgi:uracil-DNA glycosylase family 4
MGITADILADWDAALAALAWQNDMGVDEALMDAPQSAYDLPDRAEWQTAAQPAPQMAKQTPPVTAPVTTAPRSVSASAAIEAAQHAALRCQNLDDLRAALAGFDHLEIKKGARDIVFGAGHPNADVLILTDPPNREDERAKAPFSGDAAQLFDMMFAAIGLPAQALYLLPALPWRTPQDRAPLPEELAIIRPFVAQHIALISPQIVILMGNAALQLGMNGGSILRARGVWGQAFGLRALPMLTPHHLLLNPADKREAWADLLAIKAALS